MQGRRGERAGRITSACLRFRNSVYTRSSSLPRFFFIQSSATRTIEYRKTFSKPACTCLAHDYAFRIKNAELNANEYTAAVSSTRPGERLSRTRALTGRALSLIFSQHSVRVATRECLRASNEAATAPNHIHRRGRACGTDSFEERKEKKKKPSARLVYRPIFSPIHVRLIEISQKGKLVLPLSNAL